MACGSLSPRHLSCAHPGSGAVPVLSHLDDPVLTALDGLTEAVGALAFQILVEDLLERVHCIVHLLHTHTRNVIISGRR